MADIHRIRPRSAIVVGAGIVGLSTAWFLQEHGVSVTVVDRTGVAAGASWGNAGWIAPALSVPLNDPRMLRYALRSLPNKAAPVRISPSIDPILWRFLLRFARELPGVVVDTCSAGEPDAQPRVHGGLRRAGVQRGRRGGHRRADHRVVPQSGRRRASAGAAATFTGRRTAELRYGIDRCGVARAGAAGLERGGRRRPHQRAAVRQPRTVRARAGTLGRRTGRVAGHRGCRRRADVWGRASRCSPLLVPR